MVQSLLPDRDCPLHARRLGHLQLHPLRHQRAQVRVEQTADPGLPLHQLAAVPVSSRSGKLDVHALEFLSGPCGQGLGWRGWKEEEGAAVLCVCNFFGLVWFGDCCFRVYRVGGHRLQLRGGMGGCCIHRCFWCWWIPPHYHPKPAVYLLMGEFRGSSTKVISRNLTQDMHTVYEDRVWTRHMEQEHILNIMRPGI